MSSNYCYCNLLCFLESACTKRAKHVEVCKSWRKNERTVRKLSPFFLCESVFANSYFVQDALPFLSLPFPLFSAYSMYIESSLGQVNWKKVISRLVSDPAFPSYGFRGLIMDPYGGNIRPNANSSGTNL